ncbi:hypothetical protein K3495_g12081 [Podosphaera aphanis]|nr:hypothetical protein K3495_g12081 [Podosphaera aphanis]
MYHTMQKSEEFGPKKIYLIDQSTWLPWINVIKSKATRGCKENIWQFIDPSKSVQPELPEILDEPNPEEVNPEAVSKLDLNSDQFAKFKYLERRHAMKIDRNRQIMHLSVAHST